MKVKFEQSRLQMIPENNLEERFTTEITRLVQAVSNNLMAWHGDVKFDKETSGYIITWKPERNPGKKMLEELK